jgi:hypothetical protein
MPEANGHRWSSLRRVYEEAAHEATRWKKPRQTRNEETIEVNGKTVDDEWEPPWMTNGYVCINEIVELLKMLVNIYQSLSIAGV